MADKVSNDATLAEGTTAQPQAQPQPVANAEPPAAEQTTGEKIGGFWNGLKKAVGLPYKEAEYWDEENETGLKSTAERGLWGLWTYKEDSYDRQGNRTETRYYKRNNESRREEFHPSGQRSRTSDIKDDHPVGRVKECDELGNVTFEGNFDQEGLADGVHRRANLKVTSRETPFSHGKRQGEERIYDPLTGKLKKTIPWDNDRKEGVEHNLENGDFTTYHGGERDGAFRETTPVQDSFGQGRIERTGTYKQGRMHISMEKEVDSRGHLKRETTFDEDGNRHGEEKISNGVGYDVNPYNHGRLNGRQIFAGGNYTTWRDGVQHGPYARSTVMAYDEDMEPLIMATERGEYNNGHAKVESMSYGRVVMKEDGSFGSVPLTEDEAHKETARLLGVPASKARLGKGTDRTAATEPKAAEPDVAEPKSVEPKAAEPKAAEPKAVEPKAVEPNVAAPVLPSQTTEKEKAQPTAPNKKAIADKLGQDR